MLREGEPAYNTTTNQLKIGYKSAGGADQTWDQLPYVNAGAAPGLAPGASEIVASIPEGTVLSGTTVTIVPLSGVTISVGVPIRFTNITSAFTTSSIAVANNQVFYVKQVLSATEFTISQELLGGTEIVFNL